MRRKPGTSGACDGAAKPVDKEFRVHGLSYIGFPLLLDGDMRAVEPASSFLLDICLHNAYSESAIERVFSTLSTKPDNRMSLRLCYPVRDRRLVMICGRLEILAPDAGVGA
jgi:hypothetical protein